MTSRAILNGWPLVAGYGGAPAVVALPLPSFTTLPSISPTSGNVGATFSANDGVIANGIFASRRWLLSGTAIGTGTTVVPVVAGSLVLEVTATRADGSGAVVATSGAVTVSAAATAPAAPTLSASPGPTQNTIIFTDGSNGGSPITSRKVYRSTISGFTPGAGNLIATNPTFPYVDTGLTNGTTYYYKGIATNAVGDSAASAQVSGTPAAAAAAPTISGTPPSGQVGQAYSFTPTTTGGAAPLAYIFAGRLPPGTSFNTSTGAISGTAGQL